MGDINDAGPGNRLDSSSCCSKFLFEVETWVVPTEVRRLFDGDDAMTNVFRLHEASMFG